MASALVDNTDLKPLIARKRIEQGPIELAQQIGIKQLGDEPDAYPGFLLRFPRAGTRWITRRQPSNGADRRKIACDVLNEGGSFHSKDSQ